MRAVIYIRTMKNMDRQQRRKQGLQWLYEAVSASGHPEITPQTCPVQRTEKGKPYFGDRPEIQFSISHSRGLWACAVADRPVGLDLQYHKTGRLDNIPGRFFHPEEAAWLAKQGAEEDNSFRNAFFDVWTAKESYVKWTGEGIDRHFGEFSVVNDNGLAECCGNAWFWRCIIEGEYSLCLCGGETWDEVKLVRIEDEKT